MWTSVQGTEAFPWSDTCCVRWNLTWVESKGRSNHRQARFFMKDSSQRILGKYTPLDRLGDNPGDVGVPLFPHPMITCVDLPCCILSVTFYRFREYGCSFPSLDLIKVLVKIYARNKIQNKLGYAYFPWTFKSRSKLVMLKSYYNLDCPKLSCLQWKTHHCLIIIICLLIFSNPLTINQSWLKVNG